MPHMLRQSDQTCATSLPKLDADEQGRTRTADQGLGARSRTPNPQYLISSPYLRSAIALRRHAAGSHRPQRNAAQEQTDHDIDQQLPAIVAATRVGERARQADDRHDAIQNVNAQASRLRAAK